ncbi:MAG: RNA-guided pseudouridylation complex pseudouridine synthase subunit Cbf5 [Candidatus Pacearchaeota archaeon]
MISINKTKSGKNINELIEFSIINIDKPSGPTSFKIDMVIKESLNLSKTSHFGTLDPAVTGVLPIALSRACRLMPYFIGSKKSYIGTMRLHKENDIDTIKKEIKQFIGKINQLPPLKSRVKREVREREVYRFEILEVSDDKKNILFETEVQAGTYIRKLIDDMGKKIGGAHMLELRRTKASIFEEKDSYTIYEFLEAVEEYKNGNEEKLRRMLIPGEIISNIIPEIQVKNESLKKLYHGSPLFKKFINNEKYINTLKDKEKVSVFYREKFIGIFKTTVNKNNETLAFPEFVLQPIKTN